MSFLSLVNDIYRFFRTAVPFFRVGWIITILIGAALLVLALVLKRNPDRQKSPWIVGGVGLLMTISSGVQLLLI